MSSSPDLVDLMTVYARRGISDWKGAAAELRKRAIECLGAAALADNDHEATETIHTIFNGSNESRLKFIPMPKIPPKGGIDRSFFLPIRRKIDGKDTAVFELFMLVAGKNCLAFRFEPAHANPSAHDYNHVQMCRKVLRRSIISSAVPSWLPDRYPAFPIFTSDPLLLFLTMATAVHGHTGGFTTLLQTLFQAATRPGDAIVYLNELKKALH